MRKLVIILILFLMALSGCQKDNHTVLNTKNLEIIKAEGNVTEEQSKSFPIRYEASSLEEGLKALPFELKVPKSLPFEADPLKLTSIDDFKHDGKSIVVNFQSQSKNNDEMILLLIIAQNFKVEYVDPDGMGVVREKVQLKNEVSGDYYGGSIHFKKDGIYYDVEYTNNNISDEELKKETIHIANQML